MQKNLERKKRSRRANGWVPLVFLHSQCCIQGSLSTLQKFQLQLYSILNLEDTLQIKECNLLSNSDSTGIAICFYLHYTMQNLALNL